MPAFVKRTKENLIVKNTTIIKLLAFLFFALCFMPEDAYGQRRRRDRAFRFQNLPEHDHMRYHFGYTIGFSSLKYAVRPYEDFKEDFDDYAHILASDPAPGFHVGVLGNLRLGRYLDLRLIPTLIIAEERYIEFYDNVEARGDPTRHHRIDQSLGVTQLDFPLHLKYKSARMNNTRAFIVGGIKYSHDFAATGGRSPRGGDMLITRIDKDDLHYEIGVGLDHYFYYFKLGLELKASFGLRNIVQPGEDDYLDYYNSIDRVNARAIMFSIYIE